MKYKQLKLSAVFFLSLGLTGVYAQESINASGGNATGSEGSASFSVGQMVYSTHTGEQGSVVEGVQQAFEISVLGVEEFENINASLRVYPNPVSEYLVLEVKELDLDNLNFQLFDIRGRLLQSKKIINDQTTISMSGLGTAVYFVKVIQDNKEVKTFKVIKN